jgi:hypothetical protein
MVGGMDYEQSKIRRYGFAVEQSVCRDFGMALRAIALNPINSKKSPVH